jgi:hypothetical protein
MSEWVWLLVSWVVSVVVIVAIERPWKAPPIIPPEDASKVLQYDGEVSQ